MNILTEREYKSLMDAKLIKGPSKILEDGQIIIEVNGCQLARDWNDETEMLPCLVNLLIDHLGGFDNPEIREACHDRAIDMLNHIIVDRQIMEASLLAYSEGYEACLKRAKLEVSLTGSRGDKETMATIAINWKDKILVYNGGKADIVFINERLQEDLLKTGNFKDLGAYHTVGDCLAPIVYNGDLVISIRNATPHNNDIVHVNIDGESLGARYCQENDDIWLESAHGKRELGNNAILAVALLIARFPQYPIMKGDTEFIRIPVLTNEQIIHNAIPWDRAMKRHAARN